MAVVIWSKLYKSYAAINCRRDIFEFRGEESIEARRNNEMISLNWCLDISVTETWYTKCIFFCPSSFDIFCNGFVSVTLSHVMI